MFNSIQEAVAVLNKSEVSEEEYLAACEYLIAHRDQLTFRVFIVLPGGLGGNNDPRWSKVKEGSTARCDCGNERTILPLNPRQTFERGTVRIVITASAEIYIKPVGGDKSSAYFMLDIEEGCLALHKDPFGPILIDQFLSGPSGYPLKKLAEVLPQQPEPPVMMIKVGGVPIPIFCIDSVDLVGQTVTLTLDAAVEAFDPAAIKDHSC